MDKQERRQAALNQEQFKVVHKSLVLREMAVTPTDTDRQLAIRTIFCVFLVFLLVISHTESDFSLPAGVCIEDLTFYWT